MLSLMCEMSNDGNVNKKEKEEKKKGVLMKRTVWWRVKL